MAVAVALGATAPASASELRIGAQKQDPEVLYSQTISAAPHGACGIHVTDTSGWGFPAPLTVTAGSHPARILYRRKVRPEHVRVVEMQHAGDGGKPAGPRHVLDATLRPARGSAGWEAVVTVKARPSAYLVVRTRWARDRRCDLDDQSVETYSLSAGPAARAGVRAGS